MRDRKDSDRGHAAGGEGAGAAAPGRSRAPHGKATPRTTAQLSAAWMRRGAPAPADAAADAPADGGGASGAPLPESLRLDMEASFGTGFGGVRWRESADASALGADAMARGDELVFAPGRFDPGSHGGRELIGHELSHVVQQREGRVDAPQGHGGLAGVVADPALEAEADAHGAAAARGEVIATGGAARPAPARPAIQRRVTVAPETASYPADADLRAMNVQAFLRHTQRQADWGTHYTSPDKADLQQLLHDLLADPALAAGTQLLPVSRMLTLASADRTVLERYCAAVQHAETVPTAKVARLDDMDRALAVGRALPRLEVAVGGGGVLYHITDPDCVDELIRSGRLDEFLAYCRLKNPQWQAPDGIEFDSFAAMQIGFLAFGAHLPDVRNLHHFDTAVLVRLMIDRLGGHTGFPLTLVLHSGLDHNGAFHHSAGMTGAIVNNPNRVVMIEGRETLESIRSQLGAIAATYGGGHIDQVLITGHGESRSMQLAGKTTAETTADGRPAVGSADDTLDLENNEAATDAFFRELLAHMGGPNERIVLNACLTASSDLDITATGPAAVTQIKDQLRDRPSLVERLRSHVRATTGTAEVVGASGSYAPASPSLMHGPGDPKFGQLDILLPDDPALTARDRLEYVRKGINPGGVLRAVLEHWEPAGGGALTPAWLQAVNDRLATTLDTWDGLIIQAALGEIKANPDDVSLINGLTRDARTMEDGYFRQHAHIQDFFSIPRPRWPLLFEAVEKSTEWGGEDEVAAISIYQLWGLVDPAKYTALTTHLTTHAFTTSGAQEFLYGPALDRGFSTLLPPGAASAPTRGQLVIAFGAVLANPSAPPAPARDFLRTTARVGGGRFPAGLSVDDILDNSSEDEILRAIGLGSASVTVKANVDGNQDGMNERFVNRIAKHGTVVNCSVTTVHEGPGNAARTLGYLRAGDTVFVYGERVGWYAFEFAGTTGYVYNRFLALS